MQPSAIVQHAVAGEVQHQQVIARLQAEEARDFAAHGRRRLIDERRHGIEAAHVWSAQHFGQRFHVRVGRLQSRETGVIVLAVADDQRKLLAHQCTAQTSEVSMNQGHAAPGLYAE